MKYVIILERDNTVCYISEDPTLTPVPDFVVEVEDNVEVELGMKYNIENNTFEMVENVNTEN